MVDTIDEWWEKQRASKKPPLVAKLSWIAATKAERRRCWQIANNKARHCADHDNYYGENAADDIADDIKQSEDYLNISFNRDIERGRILKK